MDAVGCKGINQAIKSTHSREDFNNKKHNKTRSNFIRGYGHTRAKTKVISLENVKHTPIVSLDSSCNKALYEIVVKKVLDFLTDNTDKAIISLKVQGYKQKEIAEYLGCSESHISKRVSEIYKELKLNLFQ